MELLDIKNENLLKIKRQNQIEKLLNKKLGVKLHPENTKPRIIEYSRKLQKTPHHRIEKQLPHTKTKQPKRISHFTTAECASHHHPA